jgi:hypothetical protein
MAMGMVSMLQANQQNEKQEIRDAWKASKNLPRKKKKKVRKELKSRYAFACLDIFAVPKPEKVKQCNLIVKKKNGFCSTSKRF